MPELTQILVAKREKDYDDKKFLAAMQGVDLDANNGRSSGQGERGQKEWEDLKARVFSKGQTKDSNDIVSLQGANADKAGFGIGMGIDYQTVKDGENPFA